MVQISLLTCLLFMGILVVLASGCGFQAPTADEISHSRVQLVMDGRFKRSFSPRNIRIDVTYDDSIELLQKDMKEWMKTVVSHAVLYWEGALKVKYPAQKIALKRSCLGGEILLVLEGEIIRESYCKDECLNVTMCGDMVIPVDHLQGCRRYIAETEKIENGTGGDFGVANTDFLLYVASHRTRRCDSSIAYASYCQMEVDYDRPVAGFINMCPPDPSTWHEAQYELALSTVKHEMLHALGFSESLYAFYRDESGLPLSQRHNQSNLPLRESTRGNFIYSEKTVKRVARPNWLTVDGPTSTEVTMMVTPKVKREVQLHFNCSTLEGAELEDQGGEGTRLTHWEKRVFEHELMTGIYTQNPVISRITLAMMEDTGWYLSNYSYADKLDWGKNLGCEFVTQSCLGWITMRRNSNPMGSNAAFPFCTTLRSSLLKTECSVDRTAMVLCNFHEYNSSIPRNYQLSSNPKAGGTVILADYCPFHQEFNWQKDSQFVRGSQCLFVANLPNRESNFAAETYGRSSLCFQQSSPFEISRCSKTFVSNNFGSGCYQYTCNAKGLSIRVLNETFRCYKGGQILHVQVLSDYARHQGQIICPGCSELCGSCPDEMEPPVTDMKRLPVPCKASSVMWAGHFYSILIFMNILLWL